MKTIKLLCCFLLLSIGSGFAQSGTCGDNLTWTLSDSTLTISGTGWMRNWLWSGGPVPWWDYQSQIKQIRINHGVLSIGDGAFMVCDNLSSVIIPNSVTSIGYRAFAGCSRLTAITIPSSVTIIFSYVFSGCSSFISIDVENTNLTYSSENGVLFNKEKTVLIAYPGGKAANYTIPNHVTKIGFTAFAGCSNLLSITIPNSVIEIQNYAFDYCTDLNSIINLNTVPITLEFPYYPLSGVNKSTCILKVPVGSVELYRQAPGWQNFQQIVEIETNAIQTPTADFIYIYPNPVSENFRIGGIEENTIVTVSDVSGKIVLQHRVAPNEMVPVNLLPKGIYFVKINGETKKIVKN